MFVVINLLVEFNYTGIMVLHHQSTHHAFHVLSVTPTVLGGLFPCYAQIITRTRGCVAHNNL